MPESFAEKVRRRAGGVCEYCHLPDGCFPLPHELDHIIATKHRGLNDASNRALACFECNRSKGPCISGVDPASGSIVRLFHPRRHKWSAHFRWDGPVLFGRTAIGRTTIEVLEINLPHRVEIRETLIAEGVFPPKS
jgi:putative hemolysin